MTTIEENNLLIAWFMTEEPEVLNRDLLKAGTIESMHYYDDWIWLIDVLEKIESLGFNTNIISKHRNIKYLCHIYNYTTLNSAITGRSECSKITAVYNSVVEFIKWYNKENKINN